MLEAVGDLLYPVLNIVFEPFNNWLSSFFMPWARIVTLAFFVGTMVWVYSLKKEYVNVDAPSKHFWRDLRLWTVISMLPHVIVYLFL